MVNPMEVKKLLEEVGNGFFMVVFVKKNGQRRRMLCRRGVRKGLADPEHPRLPSYANCPDIVGVWSVADQAYKSFSVNRVAKIAGAGKVLGA